MRPLPAALRDRPFTVAQAADHGITRKMLRGSRFIRVLPGVYRAYETAPTLQVEIAAALLVLPPRAAVSHVTALRLSGLSIGPPRPLHFSINRAGPLGRDGIVVHRRQDLLRPETVGGLPVLDPIRTFLDVATQLDDRRLLWVGDWLVANRGVDVWELRSFVIESHLDGVQRARRVAELIRPGVASPMESDVRWFLRRGGLPDPDVNAEIHTADGHWLARGDLVYRRWKVVVEYDGLQHERDPHQRQWDLHRRESLEAAGWRVIVITSADLKNPQTVITRVRQALRQRGCVI